ncbi:hypothetical protein PCANC_11530 [Puccinia coronata f. sp. avenae]|uniref:Small ribosomal subunit protein mS41 n=1 Tax=Puccinia coronata f. sp. avenae TaxID=200324 RepID=A0A2N5UQS9_9BASI|nr:hypothetical protein PCANC_13890 [Puccinia coronata f. sp. avenae]PLW39996.1 hypothetical protein PCANC_11530 [Puccinia coronata f. sp. avenae]
MIHFQKLIHKISPKRIPNKQHGIDSVQTFLEALKRPTLITLATKFNNWDTFFHPTTKPDITKELPIPKERRYLLRSMELFRQGLDPKHFAVGPRKPKKFRGWGPRVQHGKRLRGQESNLQGN